MAIEFTHIQYNIQYSHSRSKLKAEPFPWKLASSHLSSISSQSATASQKPRRQLNTRLARTPPARFPSRDRPSPLAEPSLPSLRHVLFQGSALSLSSFLRQTPSSIPNHSEQHLPFPSLKKTVVQSSLLPCSPYFSTTHVAFRVSDQFLLFHLYYQGLQPRSSMPYS